MKLWQRITLSFMGLFVLMAVTLVISAIVGINRDMGHSQLHWAELLTRTVAKSVVKDTIEGNKTNVRANLERIIKQASEVKYITIVGFDGEIFSRTYDDEKQFPIISAVDHSKCKLQKNEVLLQEHQRNDIHGTHGIEYTFADLTFPLVDNLDAHIHLGISDENIEQTVSEAITNAIFAIVAILLVAILLSIYIAKTISRPLEQLTENIRNAAKRKNVDLVEVESRDKEIAELVTGFGNFMRERKQFEEDVIRYQDHLGELVKERTRSLRDEIEEHKETAKELIKAKEIAEQASKAKSEFMANMSHELRTPLNAILGFAQLLEVNVADNEQNQDSVNEILFAGKHLLSLVNEVLDLAKIEVGRVEISLSQANLTLLVDESINILLHMAEKKNVHLNFDDQHDFFIVADEVKLKQVIINLVSNAIKYNVDDGNVYITIDELNNDFVRLNVRDEGQGIADEFKDKIFVPFERFEKTGHIEGIGIGLSITRELVRKMNGNIGFESTKGEGTLFWIEIPRAI